MGGLELIMTVKKLKSILSRAIQELEMYEDDEELRLHSDTYHLVQKKGSRNLLSVVGFEGGYLDLEDISDAILDEDGWDEGDVCPGCGEAEYCKC